jgi:hypothetical protein
MDKKLFQRLMASIGQMDEIVLGVRAPSREIRVDAVKVTGTSEGTAARHSDGSQGGPESAGRVKTQGRN